MKQSEKQNKLKKERQIEFDLHSKQLEDLSELTKITKHIEIGQIEQFTKMKFDSLLFDSEICSWEEDNSEFDKRVFEKSHIVIVIEDTNGNQFGGYINKSITSYVSDGKGITDDETFIFTLKSNGRMKQPVSFGIEYVDKDYSFILFKEDSSKLFAFGKGNDILIMKSGGKSNCTCKQQSFDYQGNMNVLIGKEGNENPFTVKSLQVWQMD